MAVPYTFGTATAAIPLSQLDSNFATAITIGNTAVQLGNTVTTLNNMTLANVTISSGTVTITNVAVTTANVSGTANISTLVVTANASVAGNVTVSGNTVVTGNVTSATHILTGGTANGVVYLDTTKSLATGSALTFDGTTFKVVKAGGVFGPSNLVYVDVTSSYGGVTLNSASGQNCFFELYQGGTTKVGEFGIDAANSLVNIGGFGSYNTRFYASGSEQMRLTSTGLGIGTSSPNNKLQVNGSIVDNASGSYSQFTPTGLGALVGGYGANNTANIWLSGGVGNNGNQAGHYINSVMSGNGGGGGTASLQIGQLAWSGSAFTSGTAQVTLDASGNLGLNLTSPLSFGAGYAVISASSSTGGAVAFGQSGTIKGSVFNAGNDIYIDRSNSAGNLYFRNTGAGRTDATIDSSGNLLVGTTSTTGSISNSANVSGGVFSTANGSVSPASGVATTVATLPNVGVGTFLVTIGLSASAVTTYNAVALIRTSGTNSAQTNLATATSASISLSGLAVQVTQNSGATNTVNWSIIRLS